MNNAKSKSKFIPVGLIRPVISGSDIREISVRSQPFRLICGLGAARALDPNGRSEFADARITRVQCCQIVSEELSYKWPKMFVLG